MRSRVGILLSAAAFLGSHVCQADVYMHAPRGSNDRNCEDNANRNNATFRIADRLFDSQNNNAGGYTCQRRRGGPEVETEKPFYYVGTKLAIEWTAQHECGGLKRSCDLVIQYACEETLDPTQKFRGGPKASNLGRPDAFHIGAPRDGTPSSANDAATDTIPDNEESARANTVASRRFGMQESYDYYQIAKETSRNRGLFNADQNLRRNSLIATRQNPNGNRHGFEVPSERDYYPYWHPNPWVDIAVLHNHATDENSEEFRNWCNWYMANSQNNASSPVGHCLENDPPVNPIEGLPSAAQLKQQGKWYNRKASCQAAGHRWVDNARFGVDPEDPDSRLPWNGEGIPPVDCQLAKSSRINHLGNAVDTNYQRVSSDTGRASWAVRVDPTYDREAVPHGNEASRYLWTVPATPSKNCVLRIRYNISSTDYPTYHPMAGKPGGPPAGTPGLNGSHNGEDRSPIIQDPFVSAGSDRMLALKLNTNQYGRTFQDRSFVFEIREPLPAATSRLEHPEDSEDAIQTDEQAYSALQDGAYIYALSNKGKLGNIVQVYPSVEIFFHPARLHTTQGDFIHYQMIATDYGPARGCNNAVSGGPYTNVNPNQNGRTERHNVVEIGILEDNVPMNLTANEEILRRFTMFVNEDGSVNHNLMQRMLYLEQEDALRARGARCLSLEELRALPAGNQRDNNPSNCFKINAHATPYFFGGLIKMNKTGSYPYVSSRNNNLSNRNEAALICTAQRGRIQDCRDLVNGPLAPTIRSRDVPNAQEYTLDPEVNRERDAINPEDFFQSIFGQLPNGTDPAVLNGETFAPIEQDNDQYGDGNLEACQLIRYNIEGVAEGTVAGLAVGMVALGALLMAVGQFAVAYFMDQAAGRRPRCCYEYFCVSGAAAAGSSSKVSKGQGSGGSGALGGSGAAGAGGHAAYTDAAGNEELLHDSDSSSGGSSEGLPVGPPPKEPPKPRLAPATAPQQATSASMPASSARAAAPRVEAGASPAGVRVQLPAASSGKKSTKKGKKGSKKTSSKVKALQAKLGKQ